MDKRALQQRLGRKPPIAVNPEHRDRTAALAREAFARSRPEARMGFFAFCFRQIGFFGWRAWGMQAALLLCLYSGLRLSPITALSPLSFSVPFVLRMSAIIIALTALPTLYRSGKYRMLEVEITARIGYARLLMSRLLLVGIGDALMLSGMLAFALLYTDIGLPNALFCLLLPFFSMLAALLLLLPRVPLRALPYALFALSMAMLILTAALGARLPEARLYPAWGLLGIGLILLCAAQLRVLKGQESFLDVQFSR